MSNTSFTAPVNQSDRMVTTTITMKVSAWVFVADQLPAGTQPYQALAEHIADIVRDPEQTMSCDVAREEEPMAIPRRGEEKQTR